MLSCKVGKTVINTFEYKEEKLREWSSKGMLKCPVCGENMVYCHGDYKIAYFRHEKDSNCPDIYSEGVTEEHINGIRVLYEWLKDQKEISNLELEKWIPETRQRPDIYFERENEKYAIEYQCSPLATKYNDRRDLYRLSGLKDIWILGMNNYCYGCINTLEKDINKGISFEKRMKTIEQEIFNSQENLLMLDGNNSRIYITNNLETMPATRERTSYYGNSYTEKLKTIYAVKLKSNPLNSLKFTDILDKDIKNYDENKSYYKSIIKSEIEVIEKLIENDVNLKVINKKDLKTKYNIVFEDINNKQYTVYYDYKKELFKGFEFEFKNNIKKEITLEIIDQDRAMIDGDGLIRIFNIKGIQLCGDSIVDNSWIIDEIQKISKTYIREMFENRFNKCIKNIISTLDCVIKDIKPNSYVSINPVGTVFSRDEINVKVQLGYVGHSIFDRVYESKNTEMIGFNDFINNFYNDILITTSDTYDKIRNTLIKLSRHYKNNVIKIGKGNGDFYNYVITEPMMNNDLFKYSFGIGRNIKELTINKNAIILENIVINFSDEADLENKLKDIISDYIRELRYGNKRGR